MNKRKIPLPASLLLALLLLSGCAGNAVENVEMLRTAREAAGIGPALWDQDLRGVDAVLRPEISISGKSGLILNAVYRKSGFNDAGEAEEVKFALFLPQGSKLGQCVRKGNETSCANVSFPGASRLVRGAFAAIDEILRLAPGKADVYELHQGDREAFVSRERIVLCRVRPGQDGKTRVVTDLEGKTLAAYKRARFGDGEENSARPHSWKAVFGENPAAYRFTPGNGGAFDVTITRFIR